MNQEEWARLVRVVKPRLSDVTQDQDAVAHALSLIPSYSKRHDKFGRYDDRFYTLCAKRAAQQYLWREKRQGLVMRNGSHIPPFLYLDSPVQVDGDDDTYHSMIAGHASPEQWLMAVEEIGDPEEALRRRRVDQARRAICARWHRSLTG